VIAFLTCFKKLLLLSDAKFLDDFAIPVDIPHLDIFKATAPLTNQEHERTAGGDIFFLQFQVLGKVVDAIGKHGYLRFL
jgi:hypothetical protein